MDAFEKEIRIYQQVESDIFERKLLKFYLNDRKFRD